MCAKLCYKSKFYINQIIIYVAKCTYKKTSFFLQTFNYKTFVAKKEKKKNILTKKNWLTLVKIINFKEYT